MSQKTRQRMNRHRALVSYETAMVGVNLERADMRGMELQGINLTNSNLRGADLSGADLTGAICVKADFSRACLYNTNLTDAIMTSADLSGAYGRGANFTRARLWLAYLRHAQFKNAYFIDADMRGSNWVGSLFLGSKFDGARVEGVQNADKAFYTWWYSPISPNKLSYEPVPGWIRVDQSVLGNISVRENAAREQVEAYVKKGWVKKRDE